MTWWRASNDTSGYRALRQRKQQFTFFTEYHGYIKTALYVEYPQFVSQPKDH